MLALLGEEANWG